MASSSSSQVAPIVIEIDDDDDVGVDRLTFLPDVLLHHILSLLPTKDAAATSVLSTNWKHIFSNILNLDLNFDDSAMDKDLFESFVNKVLHRDLANAEKIRSMRIFCTKEHWPHIKTWISAAARLKVESLDLMFVIQQHRMFSKEISKCSRLTTLKLNHSRMVVPESFCLPNLKVLMLHKVGLVKEETVINLLYGCPLLEELSMIGCRVIAKILCIIVPTLKKLTLQDLVFFTDGRGLSEEVYDFEIRIETCELEEISYFDYHVAPRYITGNLEKLQKAQVDIKPDAEQEKDDLVGYSVNVTEFVIMCSMAQVLHLTGRTLQAIFYAGIGLTDFPNLTHLELAINIVCPRIWGLVIDILNLAPNIVSLDIEVGIMKFKNCVNCDIDLGEEVPSCVALNLKNISVSCFTGAKQEILLLMFLLENAKVLEKMVISIEPQLKPYDKLIMKEMIQSLPKPAAADCQVVISSTAVVNGAN